MKKDLVLVDYQMLQNLLMNVFVKNLTPESLMATVVVKKLSQALMKLHKNGLVVNVLVTCRELGTMRTILNIVVVIKVTNYSIGVFSIIMLLLIDVKLLVSMITLVLISVTYKTS